MTAFVSTRFFLFVLSLHVLNDAAAAADEQEKEALGTPTIIQLHKQYVPVVRNGRTIMYKTAYFGNVYVGVPEQQKFTVVFDSGSAHFLVPNSKCTQNACGKHRQFDYEASGSAVAIDHDGRRVPMDTENRDQVNIAFGTGEILGDFVRDVVCLSNHSGDSMDVALDRTDCISMRVIGATEMTDEPFAQFEFDGVLGLGLEELALNPEFSFFGQMNRQKSLVPRFGVFISETDSVPSEISFGGHDERRISEPIQWTPVQSPDLGYWQISIKSIRIGETLLDLCDDGTCRAIVDSGSSLIGVPKQEAQNWHMQLARKVTDGNAEVDCRDHPGPDIVFDLGGFEISAGAQDYSRPAALQVFNNKTNETQIICRGSLIPVDMEEALLTSKAFIFGEPMLRKYYTTYDWGEKQVGFSLANHASAETATELSEHEIFGAPENDKPAATLIEV